MSLRIRRGTNAERLTIIPLAGELIYTTDTKEVFIGDGTTLGGKAVTAFTQAETESVVRQVLGQSDILVNNTHTGISFEYDEIDQVITATVTGGGGNAFTSISVLGDVGTITADTPTSNLGLIEGSGISITPNFVDKTLTFSSSVNTYSRINVLNQASLFADGPDSILTLVSGNNISITTNPTTDEVTLSSTALGFVEDDLAPALGGNLNLNSKIINGSGDISITGNISATGISGAFTGSLVGDVVGSVFSDGSTVLVDGVGGLIVGDVNNRLTISQTTKSGVVELAGTDEFGTKAGLRINTDGDSNDSYDLITINAATNNPEGQVILFNRARGTLGAKTSLQNNDALLAMYWTGVDSDNVEGAAVAGIEVYVDGAPTSGVVPGRIELKVGDDAGNFITGLKINNQGVLGIVDNNLLPGVAPGTVNLSGTVKYIKVNVGGVDYAMPLYPLN